MINHHEVVHAFRQRLGPKRNGNCVYQGHNMSYDCRIGALFSYNQIIAKWWEGKIVALSLHGKISVTTSRHLSSLRGVQTWVEPIENGHYGYDRWLFPHHDYFSSVLRPGEHELAKVQFWKKLREIPNGIYDENGREYITFITYCIHNGWVVKPYGKQWGLWTGESIQHCVLPRLSDTRIAIAKWESVFNDGYWGVKTWLSHNGNHPHWKEVRQRQQAWHGEYNMLAHTR